MVYILASVVLNALAQLAMKLAAGREISLKYIFGNIPLVYAAILYLLSIFFWLKGLSGTPLSRAYPFQSLGYILVFGFSYFLLGEKLSWTQILGLSVICVGILIIGFAQ